MVKKGKVVEKDKKNVHQGEETTTVEGQRSPGGHEAGLDKQVLKDEKRSGTE